MLKKVVPKGRIIKEVRMEVYDGNTTFGRQLGTYPLIVGVPGRLELNKFYDISVEGHMLRSIVGKLC
jgi:radical SAM superfamily enzyme with C-terminal helix-hairpin-helix motif